VAGRSHFFMLQDPIRGNNKAPSPFLGRAEWVAGPEGKLPQGGHGVTGLATCRLPGSRGHSTVVAKAVRHNAEKPESDRAYRRYLSAERECYESLFFSLKTTANPAQYFPPYYGTALIRCPGPCGDPDRDEECLCVAPAGQSLGRHLYGLWREPAKPVLFDRDPRRGGVVYEESVRLVDEIWGAAAYLHACGFCHGDLKPSNVVVGMVGEKEEWARARLIDFGKAVRIGPSRPHRPATTAYEASTWSPWSPEEYMRGRALPTVGGAVDVFGLACLAIDCLAGSALEAMPVRLREPVRQAYCEFARCPVPCRSQGMAEYARWARAQGPDWDRTPAHFFAAWAYYLQISSDQQRIGGGARGGAENGTLTRRLLRLARVWGRHPPSHPLVALLGRMMHPDPAQRPTAHVALAGWRKFADGELVEAVIAP
jgi:hypothetical protein